MFALIIEDVGEAVKTAFGQLFERANFADNVAIVAPGYTRQFQEHINSLDVVVAQVFTFLQGKNLVFMLCGCSLEKNYYSNEDYNGKS